MKPKKLPTEKRIMKKLRRLVVFLRGSVSGPPPAGFGSLRRSSLLDLRKSVPEGVLTKKKKKSIMIYEGFVVITRVWKRFQTVVTKQIGSTLNRFLNNFRPLGRRRSEMKNFAFSKMNGRFATVLAVALTALILTACGGGGGGSDVVAPPVVVTPPAAVAIEPSKAVVATGLCTPPSEAYTTVSNGLCLATDTGPVRQAAKAAPRASAAVVPAITANELFDWAQTVLPSLFPAPSATIAATGFVFRFYPSTNWYAAVADDGGVYVLDANVTPLVVKYVAPITDFTCAVKPTAVGCKPVLVMTSASPLPVASPMVIASNQPLKSIVSVSILSGNNVSVAGNASLSQDKLSITITPTSALPYSATLTVTVKATNEANVEGSVAATIATEANVHSCPAPSVWTTGLNACVYPMGVKVLGTELAQLPAGCISVYATPFVQSSGFSACWKDFVVANKMKWLQTSRTMVGAMPVEQSTRPLAFASFITPTGRYQVMTMYADTGDLMNIAADIDFQVFHNGIDFVVGNDQGYLIREKTTSKCYQWRWNPPTTTVGIGSNVWDFESVTCPL